MSIYELLAKNQKKRKSFQKTEDYSFYMDNHHLLSKISRFSSLMGLENDDFNIIRANILIEAYLNKDFIEKEIASLATYLDLSKKANQLKLVAALKEKCLELPYLMVEKNKIYIPLFSIPVNIIYSREPEKTLQFPYSSLRDNFNDSIIDPFDTYGPQLYDSYFTRLVKIATNGKEIAFFHYDTNAVYVINSQGRLDCKIVLFDKYMKKISNSHMLERLRPVMERYFADDREGFINSLEENKFISSKMKNILKG